LKIIPTALFAAALLAVPAQSKAAPRNIDECEKIQAADAYNLCLASFGPVARGHHGFADGPGRVKNNQEASREFVHAKLAAAERSRHHRRHAFRHGWSRHRLARHLEHGTRAALHHGKHGNNQKMAFSVVSSRTRLR
jgi:hypothetical protein